jgi:anti-anti-sigma factor
MASNFKISTHRNSENLHLKLAGDFDGSSAMQLMNVLKKNINNGVFKIIIHTSCLNDISSFGLRTLHEQLSELNGDSGRLLFTGEKATQMAPENMCL